ncbi:MAG TPA: SDR family NAD(P)-dependent oxidoreductase [Mycobacteriales bacterium]|nr:SDR family NAD(P)-dependent oxidoreductase [Mycobacteriales bacterium]
MFDLTGKTVLITGGSRGIGAAIAHAMVAAGARVALNSRGAEQLERTAAEVGGDALALPGDVTDASVAQHVVADAISGLGHLDVVVNNVGGNGVMVPFPQLRFAGWEKVMRLNVDSAVHVLQAAGPHLLERGSGSVINVASVAGLSATPAMAQYGASKAALISLTRTLAVEWASTGVRVNALCPGWTATDLNRTLWENEDVYAGLTATIPMGRWAKAEEMAGPAVFLASAASSFMTGQTLVVDGGQTAV